MADRTVLIVDDDPIICSSLREFLRLEGFRPDVAISGQVALDRLEESAFDVVITDISMPELDGFELLKTVKARWPATIVILITGYGSIEDAVNGIKCGAYEYITKPVNDDEIKLVLDRALEQRRLKEENEALKQQLAERFGFENLIGQDVRMTKIFDLIGTVAPTEATILIYGANGTGKTSVARAIHYRSLRKDGPLVEVSCGALSEHLLESELFGHVKGAFTGAIAEKMGKFEQAEKGTIFLDEIDTLPPSLQVKLLRVLQDRKFERVGGNETMTAEVRVVAAATQDLEEKIREGSFRQDLYYRLNVVSFTLPLLCERITDIPLLLDHFLKKYTARNNKQVMGVTDEVRERLFHYSWPGNVRELENVVERAVILTSGPYISFADLPPALQESEDLLAPPAEVTSLKSALSVTEKKIIEKVLRENLRNRQKTAAQLGVNRTTLYQKMKKFGLFEEEKAG